MNNLQKRLDDITRFGMHPIVVESPTGAVTFDKMIVIYLDVQHKRMYQIFLYDTKSDKIWKVG